MFSLKDVVYETGNSFGTPYACNSYSAISVKIPIGKAAKEAPVLWNRRYSTDIQKWHDLQMHIL